MEKPTTEFTDLLTKDALQTTMLQLDAAVNDIIAVGKERETVYGNRAELMKLARQLQTEIELVESEAIMNIKGSGKDATATLPDGRTVYLTNDTARDAYRKNASAYQRKQLATTEAELEKIGADLFRLGDKYNESAAVSHSLQAKARLQAAMLEYLS